MNSVYLDYNAAAPLLPGVREAMAPFLDAEFGNPSSLHQAGQRARHAIESARETIARAIGAEIGEIFFTSGGTEANNLALWGLARARLKAGAKRIVVSAVEHPSVFEAAAFLSRAEGLELAVVPVTREGKVYPDEVDRAAESDTAVVSVMHANNETGAVQPVREIASPLRRRGIPFHVDAVQSFGKIAFDVREIGCDAATLSAHKIGGPKGAGALYVRKGTPIQAIFHGGSQEKNVRPGTENVAGIAGFAAAAEAALRAREEEFRRLVSLKKDLLRGLAGESGVTVNGPVEGALPNTLNVSFEGIDGQALVTALDIEGVCVSSGSACAAGSSEPSHVLTAMGLKEAAVKGAVRFSMGRGTTGRDIELCLEAVIRTLRRLRQVKHAG